MIISILQDQKKKSIGVTPEFVAVLVQNNHTVLVEGHNKDSPMQGYLNVGAYVINTKEELLDRGCLIVKTSCPEVTEVDYFNGEEKIFFTCIEKDDNHLIKKFLEHKISLINYLDLEGFQNKSVHKNSRVEFSNYILPFVLSLGNIGLKALVDNEVLRAALILMQGKVYNGVVAKLHGYQCHEF